MYELFRKRDFSIPSSRLTKSLEFLNDPDPVPPPPPDFLFWKMWEACSDIANDVLQTNYFKRIGLGNLDPVAFGTLMVQDAYYCFKGRDDYSAAATHALDEACSEFCKAKAASYDDYNEYYHNTWHIREASSVIPGTQIKDYADYEAYVAGNLINPYLFCVMLPCEYLWTWVANILEPATSDKSLYYFWIKSNLSPNGAYQMAKFLEKYRSQINENKAMDIFKNAMQHELNVFQSATMITSNNNFKN